MIKKFILGIISGGESLLLESEECVRKTAQLNRLIEKAEEQIDKRDAELNRLMYEQDHYLGLISIVSDIIEGLDEQESYKGSLLIERYMMGIESLNLKQEIHRMEME